MDGVYAFSLIIIKVSPHSLAVARSFVVQNLRSTFPRIFVRRSSARFVFRLNSRLASNLFISPLADWTKEYP